MGALLDPIDLQALTRAAYGILTLTPAEYRVLKSFLRGNRPEVIGQELGLTKMTAQLYLKKIYKKCGCDRLTLMRLSFALDQIPTLNRHLTQMGSVDDQRRKSARLAAGPAKVEPARSADDRPADIPARLPAAADFLDDETLAAGDLETGADKTLPPKPSPAFTFP